MTDTLALNQLIEESGMKRNAIAKRLGISETALRQKINSTREFKPSEIKEMCKILNISGNKLMSIFFDDNVDYL